MKSNIIRIVRKKKGKKAKIIISIIIGIAVICLIYGFFIEPRGITAKRYSLGNNDGGTHVKIVQLSDLHISTFTDIKYLKNLVSLVNSEAPDIVLFTGDLFTNLKGYSLKVMPEVTAALAEIDANYGKYAVFGNHDYRYKAEYYDIMAGAGFDLLVNDKRNIEVRGKAVRVDGLDDAIFGRPDYDIAKPVYTLVSDSTGAEVIDYKILMLHEPEQVDKILGAPYNLILAGHTHGGQIAIPFLPSYLTLLCGEKYIGGFYDIDFDCGDYTKLYVNTGIGMSGIFPARFGVPPIYAVFDVGL